MSDNNLCEKCNGTYVENEFHILFRCSKYYDLRKKYIPTYLYTNPSIHKLNCLLASRNEFIIKSVVYFISEFKKLRNLD